MFLHITNGSCATDLLRHCKIDGTMLAWDDVLHEGPVPLTPSLESLSEIRARFLCEPNGGAFEEIHGRFQSRDAALARCGEYDETVLWYEHDLFDQLQFIQIMDWFADQPEQRRRLSLVLTDNYITYHKPEEIVELFHRRKEAEPHELEAAREAWAAFRSESPAAIERFLQKPVTFPHLNAALLRHLEQFPSTFNGLSRSEQAILEVLTDGPKQVKSVFPASHHKRENPVFLGDTTFAYYLTRLGNVTVPVLQFTDGQAVLYSSHSTMENFWDREIALTESGEDVLRGEKDFIRLNGIDRWLGGVHLAGREARWRWDACACKIVPPTAYGFNIDTTA